MNRLPKLPRREQQAFIRDESVTLLHFAVRACPCNGVGCEKCNGKMKYYDDPIPIYGILSGGMNTSKKDPQFTTLNSGVYKLLVEPRLRIAKGDRMMPFGIREFEQIDEVLPVAISELTFSPINPRTVAISFSGDYGVIDFKPVRDFTIAREVGRVPIFSKQIKWITSPPSGDQFFSARYGYLPEFEVGEIPPAKLSQRQLLIQELTLNKITVAGNQKTKSFQPSSEAVLGMKYE